MKKQPRRVVHSLAGPDISPIADDRGFAVSCLLLSDSYASITTSEGLEADITDWEITILIQGWLQMSAEPNQLHFPIFQLVFLQHDLTTTTFTNQDSISGGNTVHDMLDAACNNKFAYELVGRPFTVPNNAFVQGDVDDFTFTVKKSIKVPKKIINAMINEEAQKVDNINYYRLVLTGHFHHACDLDIALTESIDFVVKPRQPFYIR